MGVAADNHTPRIALSAVILAIGLTVGGGAVALAGAAADAADSVGTVIGFAPALMASENDIWS